MRIQKLTLICASVSIAMLAACGGANMSGAISPRKEKTDKSGAKDASAPAVVTGAYLYCDYSPRDVDGPDKDAIGCSVNDPSGKIMALTNSGTFQFFRSVNGGSYTAPSLTNSASGWQAVFKHSKSETARSKYIVSYANGSGFDELVCEGAQLPCNEQITPKTTPMYLSSALNGIWISDDGILTDKTLDPSTAMDPTLFCDSGGTLRYSKAVWEEAAKKQSPILGGIVTVFTGGTVIENANRFSLPSDAFCAIKKKNTKSIVTSGNSCHIMVLKNKKDNRLDHTLKNSKNLLQKNATVLIIRNDTKNKSEIETLFSNSICP
jgi:hypothetical protein